MADEQVDRAKRELRAWETDSDNSSEKMLATALNEALSAYDDLSACRERDIREAVRLARGNLQTTISLDERPEETDEDVSFNDGLHTAIDRITQRGPALDPDTIRREAAEAERERICSLLLRLADAARDNDYPDTMQALHNAIDEIRSLTPPRADPEPEVCEWRRMDEFTYRRSCDQRIVDPTPNVDPETKSCRRCEHPIRIVEDSNDA